MTVELIDHMGSDLTIVNAARVSYHKQSSELDAQALGILRSMLVNGHGSPFEHVHFSFRVRVDIGVAREWFRHRIGSFNEESTRYVKMRKEFAVPEISAVRVQVGKAMEYTFEPADVALAQEFIEDLQRHYEIDWAFYEKWIGRGIAKEIVRKKLPLGLLTEFVWTINLRSLFNFLMLRNAPQALAEIRQEAAVVEGIVSGIVPATIAFWRAAGRPKV